MLWWRRQAAAIRIVIWSQTRRRDRKMCHLKVDKLQKPDTRCANPQGQHGKQ